MLSRHLLIKGKVQGVFYRVSAKEAADNLQIKGWVKNTNEGNVEIVCQGLDDNLATFIEWCKAGPKRAKVESIDIEEITADAFKNFQIIRGQ